MSGCAMEKSLLGTLITHLASGFYEARTLPECLRLREIMSSEGYFVLLLSFSEGKLTAVAVVYACLRNRKCVLVFRVAQYATSLQIISFSNVNFTYETLACFHAHYHLESFISLPLPLVYLFVPPWLL